MNSKQIEYFLEVARQGNFTKAAQLLYTAQPALSRQIANLEEELDVTLFERGKSGTQLTSIGQKYYELFLRTKQAMDELALEAKKNGMQAMEQIRIGIPEGWDLNKIVVRLGQRLKEEAIPVEVGFRSYNYRGMMAQIQANGLDALIGPERMIRSMSNLTYVALPPIRNVLICSEESMPSEVGINQVMHGLRGKKLLLLGQEESPLIREYQINYFNTKGLKLEYVEYHNVDSILLDVSVGKGIAILDSFSRGIHDAGIACLPLDLEMPICFAWKASRDTEVMRTFAEHLQVVWQNL